MKLHLEPSDCSPEMFQLSPGEIHFLWWFIQGSIMNPSTRVRLRRAWGLCQRHAWGWMVVESAFRDAYMHGPAVLYEDLMASAVTAFELRGPVQQGRVARRLRGKGPCLMCEEGYGSTSKGFVKPNIVQQGRELTQFRLLVKRTEPFWSEMVCGRCANTDSPVRCRIHLIEDASSGLIRDMDVHRAAVVATWSHLHRYARSFQFEFQGTRTDEDEAALIKAVGWCSGWNTMLSIIGGADDTGECGAAIAPSLIRQARTPI